MPNFHQIVSSILLSLMKDPGDETTRFILHDAMQELIYQTGQELEEGHRLERLLEDGWWDLSWNIMRSAEHRWSLKWLTTASRGSEHVSVANNHAPLASCCLCLPNLDISMLYVRVINSFLASDWLWICTGCRRQVRIILPDGQRSWEDTTFISRLDG